jgi:hypothetical protein
MERDEVSQMMKSVQKVHGFTVSNGLFVMSTLSSVTGLLTVIPNGTGYIPSANVVLGASDVRFIAEQLLIAAAKMEDL